VEKIILIKPDITHKNQVKSYIAEFTDANAEGINGSNGLMRHTYSSWLNHIAKNSIQRVGERFISFTYFAIRQLDNKIIGTVDIRPSLLPNEYNLGHIGCAVVPSERARGYGTEIIRRAIVKAKELNPANKAIVMSCNKDNAASKKMIENNGFIFESEQIVGNEVWLIFIKARTCDQ